MRNRYIYLDGDTFFSAHFYSWDGGARIVLFDPDGNVAFMDQNDDHVHEYGTFTAGTYRLMLRRLDGGDVWFKVHVYRDLSDWAITTPSAVAPLPRPV